MVTLDFRPDNIRRAADGKLLVAGQIEAIDRVTAASKMVKVDPRTLVVTELFTLPQTPLFGHSSVAIQLDHEIWVGSFRSHRIAILPVAPSR
jgi:hypothetical protein